jgi:hypothetical protein
MCSGSVARVQPRFHPREPARDPRDQSIELRCHRPGSMLRPRGYGHIIWTPHKPGKITRWPPHVAPPRPTLRSPAAVPVRPTCAINPPTGHPSHSLFCRVAPAAAAVDALRVVMMSSSQATAWRRESSRVGRQRYPERPFGDVPFIDPTSTSTAKASIRRSRSWRARRRPAWVSTAARCAPVPHRLSTHPTLTYLARIPSLDLRGIHVVGGSP